MKVIVQTTGGDASSLNEKTETPNKTIDNITETLLLNSSQKKQLWCFYYQYSIWLSLRTKKIWHGDVP